MPTSLLDLSPLIVAHVWEVARDAGRPISILDVGPGFGRYGLLCRELVDGVPRGRIARLDAVEAEDRYVTKFPWLRALYDNLFLGDVTHDIWHRYDGSMLMEGLQAAELLAGYDLVLMLDVIEHLAHDAALDLLDRISGRVLISTPRDYFNNPEADQGWPTERHRSHFPDAASFGQPDRLERVEADALDRWGANIVRLGPKS